MNLILHKKDKDYFIATGFKCVSRKCGRFKSNYLSIGSLTKICTKGSTNYDCKRNNKCKSGQYCCPNDKIYICTSSPDNSIYVINT